MPSESATRRADPIARKHWGKANPVQLRDAIAAAIDEAVKEERAACIADCTAEYRDDGTAQRCVQRIRARHDFR